MRTALLLLTIATAASAQTTVLSWSGATPNDYLGTSLVGPGDLNGDGIPDIVMGSTSTNSQTPTAGSVTARSGADGSTLWQAFGLPSERLGTQVARAGDVTGDGIQDIVVAAPGGRGVVLLSGATGSVIRSMPDPSDQVDGGFDFNGDAVPDQLGCYVDAISAGGVKVYSGTDGSVLLSITPNTPFVFVGNGSQNFRAHFLEDIDDDGFDDVIAGRAISDDAVRFRGPNGALGGALTAPVAGSWTIGVHDIGSVTGDDRNDVAVFWWAFGSGGNTYLRTFNSATGALIWEIVNVSGAAGLKIFGSNMARLSDIDGDGKPDLVCPSNVLILAPQPAIASAGATVVSGATGAVLFTVSSPTTDGVTVASIGDITGDGIPEFAFGHNVNGGYVAVVSPVTLPGASILDLGGACGSLSTSLTAGLPVIGSSLTVAISGGQPLGSAALVIDLASDVPTALNPCGVVHLDFAHVAQWTQILLTLDGSGAASISYLVPTMPLLEGQPFTTQAVVLGTPSPLGVDLSNGLRGAIGY